MRLTIAQPGYFDLKTLAAYTCCSVRWLRNRLADRIHPLPYHRVEGKLLVRKEDYDQWVETFRVCQQPRDLDRIVDDVMGNFLSAQQRT